MMMAVKFLFILVFAAASSRVSAQDDLTSKDRKQMVGFACFYEGSPTEPVKRIARLIKRKKYQDIVDWLKSKNNAERYLAVITLERLSKLNRYNLNDQDLAVIAEIKVDKGVVIICSGCTMIDRVSLKDLFSREGDTFSTHWLEANIKPGA